MKDFFEIAKVEKIVPVAVIDDADDAVNVAEALIKGGLSTIEVTFRTPAAAESVRRIKEKFPQMIVGAGTICDMAQLEKAVESGAEFIVCPGMVSEVVEWCVDRKIPVVPGCVTPTEIISAIKSGVKVVKYFPAETFGGVGAIKSMSQVFSGIKFMPTGGITLNNIAEYLKCDSVIACGGSFMVARQTIKEKDFGRITELTKQAVAGLEDK